MKILMGVTPKMRLYNIYRLCKQNIDIIDNMDFKNYGSYYSILNWKEYNDTLLTLRNINVLNGYINNFIQIMYQHNVKDGLPILSDTITKDLNKIKNKISNIMNVIIEFYESMNISNEKNGIDIKLPPCEDLKEYINYLKEFDFIFSQCPFLQCENETLKFESVDVGSNWIRLAVASTSTCFILSNIGALVDKAIMLRSHYITVKQQEETLKAAQMKNELAEDEIKFFNSIKDAYMNTAIKELQEKCGELKDGEEKGKAEKSLKKLCELIDKGAEIYASIDAPEEIQVLFPDIQSNLELPGELVKYLEDKELEDASDD